MSAHAHADHGAPTSFVRRWLYSTNHKDIGTMYLVFAILAAFIGGGLSEALLQSLWQHLPAGTRVVANSVTLETDTLLSKWHAKTGGSLIRIEVSNATPLGTKHSWKASYPVSQWSAVKCR